MKTLKVPLEVRCWLIKEGVFEKWNRYTKRELGKKGKFVFNEFQRKLTNTLILAIIGFFSWSNSKENYMFWRNIDNKYIKEKGWE